MTKPTAEVTAQAIQDAIDHLMELARGKSRKMDHEHTPTPPNLFDDPEENDPEDMRR